MLFMGMRRVANYSHEFTSFCFSSLCFCLFGCLYMLCFKRLNVFFLLISTDVPILCMNGRHSLSHEQAHHGPLCGLDSLVSITVALLLQLLLYYLRGCFCCTPCGFLIQHYRQGPDGVLSITASIKYWNNPWVVVVFLIREMKWNEVVSLLWMQSHRCVIEVTSLIISCRSRMGKKPNIITME